MDESYLARKDNKILLSSDIYRLDSIPVIVPTKLVRTHHFLLCSPRQSSDSPQSSFRLGSNHVRSIPSLSDKDEDLFGSGEDGFHNSLSSQLERRRHPQALDDNRTHRDNSAKKGSGHRSHSGGVHRKRPRRHRNHNSHTSKGRHQCQTNSNSCDDDDDDTWLEGDGVRTNGDLIRSLDQRKASRGRGDHVNKRKAGQRNETRRSRLQRERRLRRRRERRLRKMRQKNQRMLAKRKKEGGNNRTRSDDYEVSLSPGAGTAEVPGPEQRRSHELKARSAERPAQPAASCAAYIRHKSSQKQQPSVEKTPLSIHLVDTCSWPHCNRSCPKLKNPETGKLLAKRTHSIQMFMCSCCI
jgi:hypothetical protein